MTSVSVCMSACVTSIEKISMNTNLPERLPMIWRKNIKKKKKKIFKKLCYNTEENCQQVLLIGACCIQCWCVVVLVHKCLFNHPFSPLGVGSMGRMGVASSPQKGGEKNRVFCYCPIRGWQFVYIYIVYMWSKCFLCDTTFYLYYGSTFSVSVLLIYIWFVSLFFDFVSCHFLYVIFVVFFSLLLCPLFCSLHGLLLWSSDEVTQLTTLCIRLVL